MLTIFTIPKSFENPDINIIQRNAILSWLKLRPQCEVILFGDEKGIKETAKEFGVFHIPQIEKNEFGTPLLNSVFSLAQKEAKNNILVYANCDIIFLSDFLPAVQKIQKQLFLMSGRRWDLDIKEEINFDDLEWERRLRGIIRREGKLHGFSGIDYFVFSRNLPHNLPPFAVGRPAWDNWLIHHLLSLKIPVIDATQVVTIIHQNHESSHLRVRKDAIKQKEARKNLELAEGLLNLCTLWDSNWILTSEGLKKPPFPRRILAELSLFYPWRILLSIKRRI